ncbi:MAG: hypothetical protein Ct9H300mP7_4310 [Verrucomicrobiota bacterium]|nr:MAG: hypothetical protein Ct9H300mP7_4310 [Verrucomicrobiota bacterium]
MTSGSANHRAIRAWPNGGGAIIVPAMLRPLPQLADGTDCPMTGVRRHPCLTDGAVTPEAKADFLTALAAKGERRGRSRRLPLNCKNKALPVRSMTRRADGDARRLGARRRQTRDLQYLHHRRDRRRGSRRDRSQAGKPRDHLQARQRQRLAALGIPTDLTPGKKGWASLRIRGFAFLFAPGYHPAFKHIMPARKLCPVCGQRTVFNFLGPLLNPARPTAKLIGFPKAELCEPIGRVLQPIGSGEAGFVNGKAGKGGPWTNFRHSEKNTIGEIL